MRKLMMVALFAGSITAAAAAQAPQVDAVTQSILDGAIAGAVVSGRPGAIWADQDHDGRVDGYTYNGQYYVGAPANVRAAPMPPVNQPNNRTGERG